ncbi:MAG: trimethylamine methyltransferase family protein, partial [Kiloniellales bacterium]
MARDSSRRRSRGDRAGGGLNQPPWRALKSPFPPLEILNAEQLEAIHNASMTILEEIGMDFLHPEALEILGKAGAKVESGSSRVRFDRGLVTELVAKAPSQVTLHARNP